MHIFSLVMQSYIVIKASPHICIVGYPKIHYSAILRYVPWAIWLGISRNDEQIMRQFHWFRKETAAEN